MKKKNLIISLLVGITLLFVFVYIYQVSNCLHESYRKQEFEKQKKQLEQKKQALTHELYQAKNRDTITAFAKTLGLQPIRISQVKKLQ